MSSQCVREIKTLLWTFSHKSHTFVSVSDLQGKVYVSNHKHHSKKFVENMKKGYLWLCRTRPLLSLAREFRVHHLHRVWKSQLVIGEIERKPFKCSASACHQY